MARATPLQRAKAALRDAYIVDVRRGVNGALVVVDAMESPAPIRPGRRYWMLDGDEMEQVQAWIAAAEASAQLTRLMRKRHRSGRQSSPRR